ATLRSDMAETPEPRRFFLERYGLSEGELEHILGDAVGRRADHADLYFEFTTTESLQIEESLVKKATRGVSQGVGVRVVAEDRTGYAYSDEVTLERLRVAARTARAIAADSGVHPPSPIATSRQSHELYRVEHPAIETDLDQKIAVLNAIDVEARRFDARI